MKRVLEATLRGWEYAMAHPTEIVDILINDYGVEKSREHLLAEAEAIRRLMLPDLVEIGHMNAGRWHHIGMTYVKLGLLNKGFSLDDFLFNPNPIPDYTWVRKTLVVAAIITLLGFGVSGVLIIYNRRLTEEVNGRRRVEEELRKSETKFRLAFETSPDSIIINRLEDGVYLEVNGGFLRMSGYSKEDVLGRSSLELGIWENPQDRKRLVTSLKKDGIVDNLEVKLRTKDGRLKDYLMSARVMEIGAERVILSITRDITQYRKARADKVLAQKIAAEHEKYALVGQVARKMAHDFNNILSVVMEHAELAMLSCSQAPLRETLNIIFGQAMRSKNLTKNLVAFAKDQEPKQQYFQLNEKIDLVVNLLKKDLEDIEVIKEYSRDMADLLADPGMIEHSLVNIIVW